MDRQNINTVALSSNNRTHNVKFVWFKKIIIPEYLKGGENDQSD